MAAETTYDAPTLVALLDAHDYSPVERAAYMSQLGKLEALYRTHLKTSQQELSQAEVEHKIRKLVGDTLALHASSTERYVTQRVAELHGSDEYEQYRQEIFDAPRRRKGDERKDTPFFPKDLFPTNPEAWKDTAVELPSPAGARTVSLPSPLVLLTETTEWEREKQVEHYWYRRYRQLIETKDAADNTSREAVMWALAGKIRIQWDSRNRDHVRAEAELKTRADLHGIPVPQLLRELILAAMIQVVGEREREQYHRFGEKWETGDDGKKRQIVPDALPWHDGDNWLFTETRNATIAELLDRNYPDNDDLTVRGYPAIPKVLGLTQLRPGCSADAPSTTGSLLEEYPSSPPTS